MAVVHDLQFGSRNSTGTWTPFEFDLPIHGPQAKNNIKTPFLKKFWVIWDSPTPATKGDDLYIGNISDNPKEWTPYSWTEPVEGPQTAGELTVIRGTGGTGTMMCGLWRTGVGIVGCKPDGSCVFPYTLPLGDETILVLEGHITIVEEKSGKVHKFKAGDIFALPSGLKVTWTSETPFVKKYWVITNANHPSEQEQDRPAPMFLVDMWWL
ncbi:hypothetical protein CLAIMM_00371 [Cladophialophora immunda]|nr:hypothetical protein CLAIMM_00371 [Cladophialophora immunda]